MEPEQPEDELCEFCKKRKATILYYTEITPKSYNPYLKGKCLCTACDKKIKEVLK
jgi:hypothetical protein